MAKSPAYKAYLKEMEHKYLQSPEQKERQAKYLKTKKEEKEEAERQAELKNYRRIILGDRKAFLDQLAKDVKEIKDKVSKL
jgi:hypothetical protein